MAVTKGQHLIGKRLGSCTLEKLLGHGGSSAVFLAQEDDPKRKVAVKVFLPRASLDNRMQRDFYWSFLREAEAASKLDHPNILPVYSYGEEDGIPYIVMPYMSGGTLAEHIFQCSPLSWLEVQWYIEQLASALDYAHLHGCVHCDVKPANILLDSEGHVLLSDFGIARLTRNEEDAIRADTSGSGVVMGTPDYISPEQALGRPLDGRSDVYSLAVTVFFLLTKRLPFNGTSPIALALLHVHEAPPSLSEIRADIPLPLDQVVHKALAKDPAQRFQTAGEFSEAFASVVLANTVGSLPRRWSCESGEMLNYEHNLFSNELSILVRDMPTVLAKPIQPAVQTNRSLLLFILVMLTICIGIVGTVGAAFATITNGFLQLSGKSSATVLPVADLFTDADAKNWPNSSTFFFRGKSHVYSIVNKSANEGALALYYNHLFKDFRLTVTMEQVHSSPQTGDYYGVIFRATSDQSHYYLFEIAPSNHKHYAFLRYDQQWTIVADGTAPSLVAGVRKKNTVSIEARRNTFSFEINGKSLAQSIPDTTQFALSSGLIGLYVEDQGAEVAFSQLYEQKF